MNKLKTLGVCFLEIAFFLFFLSLNFNDLSFNNLLSKNVHFSISGKVIENQSNYISLIKDNFLFYFSLLFFCYGFFLFLLDNLEKRVSEKPKIISRVKEDPLLLKVAMGIGKNPITRKEINHLIGELNKGNINPGLGTKYVDNGIYELRGRNGGRVYYRINSDSYQGNLNNETDSINQDKFIYEILAYSDKDTQQKVIDRLREIN